MLSQHTVHCHKAPSIVLMWYCKKKKKKKKKETVHTPAMIRPPERAPPCVWWCSGAAGWACHVPAGPQRALLPKHCFHNIVTAWNHCTGKQSGNTQNYTRVTTNLKSPLFQSMHSKSCFCSVHIRAPQLLDIPKIFKNKSYAWLKRINEKEKW